MKNVDKLIFLCIFVLMLLFGSSMYADEKKLSSDEMLKKATSKIEGLKTLENNIAKLRKKITANSKDPKVLAKKLKLDDLLSKIKLIISSLENVLDRMRIQIANNDYQAAGDNLKMIEGMSGSAEIVDIENSLESLDISSDTGTKQTVTTSVDNVKTGTHKGESATVGAAVGNEFISKDKSPSHSDGTANVNDPTDSGGSANVGGPTETPASGKSESATAIEREEIVTTPPVTPVSQEGK